MRELRHREIKWLPHAKGNSAVSTFNCGEDFFNLVNIYFKHLPKVAWSVFPEDLLT